MRDLDDEQWAPIPGHPRHQASTMGRVRALQPNRKTPRILKPLIKSGTPYYALHHTGEPCAISKRARDLIFETFHRPLREGESVYHINGNIHDCRPQNLTTTDPELHQPGEEWRPITDHKHYLVSNLGRVYRLPRPNLDKRCISGRIITPLTSKKGGSPRYAINDTYRLAATLVAAAFIRPLTGGETVIHTNGDKNDCRAENLVIVKKKKSTAPPKYSPEYRGPENPAPPLIRDGKPRCLYNDCRRPATYFDDGESFAFCDWHKGSWLKVRDHPTGGAWSEDKRWCT